MAGVSPLTASSFSGQQLPTPSPFSFSVSSNRWSSTPPIHLSNLFLRFLALLLCFISALLLSAPAKKGQSSSSFAESPELMYCFVGETVTFVYSAFQLFKGVCDISYRGILISDRTSDYSSFVLDQLMAYLLISSSSVGILGIQKTESGTTLWKAAIISVSMSFAIFIVIATCALLSYYRLCKRIIW